jgi:biotin carboxyl carrier protein
MLSMEMLTEIGDSFVAGDVLLEIETDKAQMDVEAQDDGIMAKIIVCTVLLRREKGQKVDNGCRNKMVQRLFKLVHG